MITVTTAQGDAAKRIYMYVKQSQLSCWCPKAPKDSELEWHHVRRP